MNNLATIQTIKSVRKHPNADALDLVEVLGWTVVAKRDEFKVGDFCVYICIDTILPEQPTFEFLRNKHFRIKPIRLRGEASAGICFPLSILPMGKSIMANDGKDNPVETQAQWETGDDVTNVLGVKHYEKPMPAELAGQAFGTIPGFLIVTDEDNLRSYPDAVPELHSHSYYITRKEDGSSGTFFIRNGEFGVCSRRIHLKESESNGFWKMARKYNIEQALRTAFPDMDIAIQGEIVGPGIQKNNLGLKELELRVFNVFDIKSRYYLSYEKLVSFTTTYNIPMVPLIEEGNIFSYTLDGLIKLANEQKYPTDGPAEGIVVRPKEGFVSTALNKSWSGKVLNENYKEKD